MDPVPNWFIALPATIDNQWFHEKSKTLPSGLHLFNPEDLHATVAFLGKIDKVDVERLKDAIDQVEAAPLHATLGVLKPLPTRKFFTALSLTLAGGNRDVAAFIAQWGPRFSKTAGKEPDKRQPLPHITIARPSRSASAHQRTEIIDSLDKSLLAGPSIVFDRIALYTWADDRTLRQFKIVHEKVF